MGQVVTLKADYVAIRPQLSLDRSIGLSLSGDTGAQYRVEFATDLTSPISWTSLTTVTLSNSPVILSNTQPASAGSRFYRAVLVP